MTDVIHENPVAAEGSHFYVSAPPGAKATDNVWAVLQAMQDGMSRREAIVVGRLTKSQAVTEAKRLNRLKAQDHVHAVPAGTTGPAIEVRDGAGELQPRPGSKSLWSEQDKIVVQPGERDEWIVSQGGEFMGSVKKRKSGWVIDAYHRDKPGGRFYDACKRATELLDAYGYGAKENPTTKDPTTKEKSCACSPQSPAPRSAAYEACLAEGAKLGPMRNPRRVYDLVSPAMAKEEQETFVVVPLDARYQLRGAPVEVHRGAASSVQVSTQQVLRAVAMSGAASYVVCHNHPSGKCSPSRADQALTKHLEKSTKAVYGQEVLMVDHLIIGRGQYFSFRENKLHKVP